MEEPDETNRVCSGVSVMAAWQVPTMLQGAEMNNESSQARLRARRGYAVIDQADEVDVTSYDSFPASDPPSWIRTGIGSPHLPEPAADDSTRGGPVSRIAAGAREDTASG